MLNIKKLLQKICEEIYSLLSWTNTYDDKIQALGHRGEYYRVGVNLTDVPGPSTVNVPTNTYINILSITVPAGRWLLYGQVNWAANATGRRYIYLGSNSAASNTWRKSQMANASSITTRQNLITQGYYSAPTTVYLVGYQSSGTSLAISTAEFMAVRIA